MRICIDGLGASMLKNTGLGVYTYEFLNKLFEMYPQPKYDLIWEGTKAEEIIEKNKGCSFINLNINRKANDYSNIGKYIVNNKVNIYHSLNNGFSIPKNKTCNYISTVHDLLPLVNAEYVDPKYLNKFKSVFTNAVENSDKIIAVSEVIKEQLRSYFDIPEKKIQVIYPGYSDMFTPQNHEISADILKSKYNIENDYILYVGSIHVRKNLDKLFRAFKEISKNVNNIKLVVIGSCDGKRKDYFLKLMNLIEELNLKDSVVFLGVVDYKDMPYFYSEAKCVVNLSKYEGFPLTSLEAMACGTPVVCNNQAIFKEVFGSTTSLVDANDKGQLIQGIIEIICNNEHRTFLSKTQIEQSKKYRWYKNIIKTVGVYESFF